MVEGPWSSGPASALNPSLRWLQLAALFVCLVGATSSCGSLRRFLSKDESQQRALHLQDVQLKVMRFADEYSGRINEPVQQFNSLSVSPEDRLRAQNWRLSQATSAYTIASGPNPTVNAVDMVVLATLSRAVVEDYWVGELYRERATRLLDVHRSLEQQVWTIVEGVLTEEQRAQLREVIEQWRAEHPHTRAVAHVHFASFARSLDKPTGGRAHQGGGLFSFLGLDPLGNLDPAVREIEQTRQLAERTIYYLQRAPSLLDMQIERLVYQLAVMPETKATLLDVERISLAAAAAGDLANNLPALVARERHATIAELTAALHAEQAELGALLKEVRETLNAGSATSDSVGETLRTLDVLTARFGTKDAAPAHASAPARPFDITEYADTARELTVTAQALQSLIAQVDSSSAGVEQLSAAASRDLRAVVDHAFWRGVYLILVLAVVILLATLSYRYAAKHIAS